MSHRLLIVFVAFIAIAGCGTRGPVMHPVRGTVRVNNQPAERVVVSFHHVDPSVKGNAAHPCAVTDAKGEFKISTHKDGDGAVEGEYLASFTWASNPDPDLSKDLLGGAYDESKQSKFRVKVSDTSVTELQPFDLTADPASAKTFVK